MTDPYRFILPVCATLIVLASLDISVAQESKPVPNRPKVPGKLKVHLRQRITLTPKKRYSWKPLVKTVEWNASETAIIICDMWDNHYCKSSAQRVDAMAPKMNRVITAARNHGVMIIHAPSSCMDKYADTPYRKRMQQAKFHKPPVPLKRWCYLEPEREKRLPIDDRRSPCDDPVVGPRVRKYTRQHKAIKIIGYDGVSDKGPEIYNMLRALGIKNVAIMGVHTNMCVLGRPFGIRQMVKVGFNVALVRDLTDAMYDPREYPYVSHTRGTQLVVEHIEKFWCPSILGKDLTKVIPGSDDPDPSTLKSATRDEPRKR
ncbi:MAG: isochorismatase family protein [Planctomycetaceae bacterium]